MNGQSTSFHPNVQVYQKDTTCAIDKHERTPNSDDPTETTMAKKGFTNNDILVICSDIARAEKIVVLLDDHIKAVSEVKKESSISQKLKSVKGALSKKNSSKPDPDDEHQHNTEAIPGLQGRDIVAVAILVGKDGGTIKSYTENDEIPSDEIEAADNVFLSRVPVNAGKLEDSANDNVNPNKKSLADILSGELEDQNEKRLLKRMSKVLTRLHTTDLSTARSFLRSERYNNVRKAIKSELIAFVNKDLKLVVGSNDKH